MGESEALKSCLPVSSKGQRSDKGRRGKHLKAPADSQWSDGRLEDLMVKLGDEMGDLEMETVTQRSDGGLEGHSEVRWWT